eukprot:GILK01014255.1.p1 GENE.GILK01014255.1~~GILK01014255.1.p1  ORF type:complete len:191 (+),score=5.91 GILK01014255.1:73-645(+)
MDPEAVNQPSFPVINTLPTAGTNQWSTGLFNCLDDQDGCIEGAFCGPCQRTRQYNMLANGVNTINYPILGVGILVDACLHMPIAQTALAFRARQDIRRRYRLEGNDLQDLCVTMCCLPLSTCQNYREMSARGEWPSGSCAQPPAPTAHIPMPNEPSNIGHGEEVVEVAAGHVLQLHQTEMTEPKHIPEKF